MLDHPQRIRLAREIHSRPFLHVKPPARVIHLALFAGDAVALHHEWLADLCAQLGISAPGREEGHFYCRTPDWSLKWENHSEFSTYTFSFKIAHDQVFASDPLSHLPGAWLAGLKKRVISMAQLAFICTENRPRDENRTWLASQFSGNLIAGSKVMAGGEAWSDFLIQRDGTNRFLLRDLDLRELQAGRLSQRILEIDTYRMMALLALPVARECQPVIREAEVALADISREMSKSESQEKDSVLLERLTGLAVKIEAIVEENNYRFSASAAYYGIIRSRLNELREVRIEGVPTFGEFLERRLLPAMELCESVRRRQHELLERLTRTESLLRTRVTMAQERQNSAIIESLNKRAEIQLHLQYAVEGFSIIAITYYLTGLLSFGLKAAEILGAPLKYEIAIGSLLPFVMAGVWFGVHRVRRDLRRRYAAP